MSQQLSVFSGDASRHEVILQDGALAYYPQFFTGAVADGYFRDLQANIPWKQESMNMYGKEVLFPRLMAWHGDAGSAYAFSGKTYVPNPWTAALLAIKQQIEPVAGAAFNSVLLNLYRNGRDAMGWHADDEPELGRNPVIASVNFGASRRFMLRYKQNHQLKYELELAHGSLLIMKGTLQHYWQHQVPRTAKPLASRINLTFRMIKH
ncbi:alpha-ketoglutarate-dependent dioxygenase AlkB [Chitinophaga agrisoli]|uniref:Alpha-ketoglutarate-dependent dioxygenase AlkB n=1 Tax=Chitinophaga agrisoli TaxID=2607653 RepID=A0A5B2VZ58_9BACT|nr:alpha-ketoglutarate-dependent dioxygenase AlkB [Chitinophaga agrisoli]KAA2245103.1 alpha-ketoglutarate-dependent dioxygenase AlkB [Chitinophaga agrisoli]